MKIVINKCYGGFGLSHEAIMRYGELQGSPFYVEQDGFFKHYYTGEPFDDDTYFSVYDISRTDHALVQLVEEMGLEANGKFAELKIIDIPDDIEYTIEEYDGIEWIAEKHRTWG